MTKKRRKLLIVVSLPVLIGALGMYTSYRRAQYKVTVTFIGIGNTPERPYVFRVRTAPGMPDDFGDQTVGSATFAGDTGNSSVESGGTLRP